MTYKIQILDTIDNNVNIWGGKAVALSKLIQSGVVVPKGFAIPSEYYDLYKQELLNIDLFEQDFRETYKACFPDEETNLIFRSSANIEGSEDNPCCGVFGSYIHNSSCSFFENVRRVWESIHSQHALEYYQYMDLSIEDVKMCVIVQEVKKGKFNAVIQSYDIINDRRNIILEYTDGALNSIVDDHEDSQIIYINNNPGNKDEDLSLGKDINRTVIESIRHDCSCIEKTFASYVELEAQIFENNIVYLQARKI